MAPDGRKDGVVVRGEDTGLAMLRPCCLFGWALALTLNLNYLNPKVHALPRFWVAGCLVRLWPLAGLPLFSPLHAETTNVLLLLLPCQPHARQQGAV